MVNYQRNVFTTFKCYLELKGEDMDSRTVQEREHLYVIELELHDFKKEQISIYEEKGYIRIYAGTNQKRIYVGNEISRSGIRAAFSHNILKIMIPKGDALKEEHMIKIDVV